MIFTPYLSDFVTFPSVFIARLNLRPRRLTRDSLILISDGTLKAGVVVKAIHVGRLWIEFEVKEKNDSSIRGAGVV